MKYFLLFISLNLFSQKDYSQHYIVSVNMSSFFTSSVYFVTKKPLLSTAIGVVTSFGVGMAKEFIYDGYLGKGTKSMADLDADGRGSIVGGMFSFAIIDMIKKKQTRIDTMLYNFN